MYQRAGSGRQLPAVVHEVRSVRFPHVTAPSLCIVVADGLRPDSLDAAISAGAVPALARLRAEGGAHTITTCFPSVTGLAYAPFLMGKHPADVGLPGMRWIDRTRQRVPIPAHARSYVGYGIKGIDLDMDPTAPTLFELAQPGMSAMSMITRGLPLEQKIARGFWWGARGVRTHFFGNLNDWLQVDREVADIVARRVRAERPRFTLAALMGIDKASHAKGHASAEAARALEVVDTLVERLRSDAQADGIPLRVWVVSDHGHSPVSQHDELADVVRATGEKVIAHPWVIGAKGSVGVMVGGNAMAELYLDPATPRALGWEALAPRWSALADTLLARDSIDLMALPLDRTSCLVRARGRGEARIHATGDGDAWRVTYEHRSGDPLGIAAGTYTRDESWDSSRSGPYPDALVQFAHLAASPRIGDIILSAAPGWDLRARYEPMPHVSTHGAITRDHMRVPLLLDRPPAFEPRRTTDVMHLACEALGVSVV